MIQDLVKSDAPTIITLDRKSVELCIFTCIGDYLDFIGCSMDDSRILETAQMMIDAYPHLPINAIKTFFYECKRGAYGYHYNKMDGSKLLMWYKQFAEEYYQRLDDMQYEEHMAIKNGGYSDQERKDDVLSPDELANTISRILHNGKTVAEVERGKQAADIRLRVINDNLNIYKTMPAEDAERIIEEKITQELQKQNIITF